MPIDNTVAIECQHQEQSLLAQEDKLYLDIEAIKQKNQMATQAIADFQEMNIFLKKENRNLSEYVSKLNIMESDFLEVYYNIEDRLEAVIEMGESFLKTGVNTLR